MGGQDGGRGEGVWAGGGGEVSYLFKGICIVRVMVETHRQ